MKTIRKLCPGEPFEKKYPADERLLSFSVSGWRSALWKGVAG
jgi:hypothetical protein